MATAARLEATVNIGARLVPRLVAKAYVTPASPQELFASVEINVEAGQAATGQTGRQIVGMLVRATLAPGIAYVHPSEVRSLVVERSKDAGEPLELELDGAFRPWPTELAIGSPPPGRASIDVLTGYGVSTGMRWRRYCTNMVADSSARRLVFGEPSRVTALGRLFRYDKRRISYVRDQGHGLTAEEMIRDMAYLAGFTDVAISPGDWPLKRAFQVNCAEWLGPARALADSVGKHLVTDRMGTLTLIPKTGNPQGRRHRISDLSIVSGGEVAIETTGDVVTRIVISGEQVTSGDCSRVTTIQKRQVWSSIPPTRPGFQQSAAGVVSAAPSLPLFNPTSKLLNGNAGDPIVYLIEETEIAEEVECGAKMATRMQTKRWVNPRRWRYEIDAAGVVDGWNAGFLYEDEGSAELHAWAIPRFMVAERSDTVHQYATASGSLPYSPNPYPALPWEPGGLSEGQRAHGIVAAVGTLARSLTWQSGWYMARAAVYDNQLGSFLDGAKITGPGVGVSEPGVGGPDGFEQYLGAESPHGLAGPVVYHGGANGIYVAHLRHEEDSTEDNFKVAERDYRFEPFPLPGARYAWAMSGEPVSRNIGETIGLGDLWAEGGNGSLTIPPLHTEEETTYSAAEGRGLTTIVKTVDHLTGEVRMEPLDTPGDQHLPRATMRDETGGVEAQSWEVGPIIAPGLEIHHEVAYDELSSEYIEDPEHGKAMALLQLRIGSAHDATVEIPANWNVEPGDTLEVRVKRPEVVICDIDVTSVVTAWPGRMTSICKGRIYVV